MRTAGDYNKSGLPAMIGGYEEKGEMLVSALFSPIIWVNPIVAPNIHPGVVLKLKINDKMIPCRAPFFIPGACRFRPGDARVYGIIFRLGCRNRIFRCFDR
jgi:hypothetical protein